MNGNWSDLNAINRQHSELLKQAQRIQRDRERLTAQHGQHLESHMNGDVGLIRAMMTAVISFINSFG